MSGMVTRMITRIDTGDCMLMISSREILEYNQYLSPALIVYGRRVGHGINKTIYVAEHVRHPAKCFYCNNSTSKIWLGQDIKMFCTKECVVKYHVKIFKNIITDKHNLLIRKS